MGTELVGLFREYNALLDGHFLLSSGLHSDQYMQCALILQHPHIAEEVCKKLAALFQDTHPTVVIGPALGGVVVAQETARAFGNRAIFAERVNGKMTLRRGFRISPEDKVLVVEDVITTGGSVKEVIEVVKEVGAEIVGVGSLIDRSEGNADFGGIVYKSLSQVKINTYSAEECPLCKAGKELVKPGSKTKA